LTQEVFVKVFTHVESYQATAKFTTYLYRIARNTWIDHLRRTKHQRHVGSLDATNEDGRSLGDSLALVTDGPDEELGKRELVERVLNAISSLDEQHREVLVMSEVRGMRYSDIAEALGIPVGTVKSRMFNAMKRLRKKLAGLEKNER
jgi:RNA polymerase sigma-70 factor (ECF subfamily)